MGVGEHPGRSGAEQDHRARQFGEPAHLLRKGARSAASLDGDAPVAGNQANCFIEGDVVGGHLRGQVRAPGQGIDAQGHRPGLCVDRRKQVERTGPRRMEDGGDALPHRLAQRFGRVQGVGASHQCGDLAVDPLHRLGDLLHVVAFPMRRLVPVDVVDADAVGTGRQRSGHGLQGARADRGDDGAAFAIGPAQRCRRMRHFDLVAELPGADESVRFVDAQGLGQRRGAMAEDGEELTHALAHQAEQQRLAQRQRERAGQHA